MTDISVKDSEFDIKVTSSYYMSIQAHLNGLSFCILDPVTNKYILLEHREFKQPDYELSFLKEQLASNMYFSLPYKKVYFLYNTGCFTLIPTPLFSEEKVVDLLNFNGCEPKPDESVVSNKISMCDSINVFLMPDALLDMLKAQFADIRIIQQVTPMIESAMAKRKNQKHNQLLIHIQHGSFEIIAIRSHSLMLCNSFAYTNEKDLIYLVLFAFEQLGFKMAETSVEVSGDVAADDPRFVMIRKYLKECVMTTLPFHYGYNDQIRNVESQRFVNLFNLPICV